jgi:hypothetical protein
LLDEQDGVRQPPQRRHALEGPPQLENGIDRLVLLVAVEA